jgi:hypothetical protein
MKIDTIRPGIFSVERIYPGKTSISAWLVCLILAMGSLVRAQNLNVDYEKIRVGDATGIFTWIQASPVDQDVMAISSAKGNPMYIYSIKKREVLRQFSAGDWAGGSRLQYSKQGKYITLQQLFYFDMSPNRDKEVAFEVVDAETGNVVKRFDNYHSVVVTPDEKFALTLSEEEVAFWDLGSGEKTKSFTVPGASNYAAISPDGRMIAVAHRPQEEYLKSLPQFSKDKQALKTTLKFKQMITVFDAESFSKMYSVGEFYDIIFTLSFSEDSKTIYCYNISHTKIQTALQGRQGYVSLADATTGEPSRTIFLTLSNFEPDYKLSPDRKLFGVVTNGKFPEVLVYNYETGKIQARFELTARLLEGISDGEFPTDGRTSFEFLPDSKSMVIVFGNRLLLWRINL